MADGRKLGQSEKVFGLWTSDKGRDRADARRQIAGLSQGDAQLQLLSSIVDQMTEQTALLRYMCERLANIEVGTRKDGNPPV
jgi:hypothetical protein